MYTYCNMISWQVWSPWTHKSSLVRTPQLHIACTCPQICCTHWMLTATYSCPHSLFVYPLDHLHAHLLIVARLRHDHYMSQTMSWDRGRVTSWILLLHCGLSFILHESKPFTISASIKFNGINYLLSWWPFT